MAVHAQPSNEAAFSIPAFLAVICALISFSTGAFVGLLAAIGAIVFGVLGFVVALLPHKRGGMLSVFSIAVGLFGIIAALFKLVF
jgi:hypothetical protein